MVLSGTIGMGLFDNTGEILSIAGPGGGIIAFIFVGLVVICVMEGIAEMLSHWPIANGMIEFIRTFVDEDLAVVMGFAYWYLLPRLDKVVPLLTGIGTHMLLALRH